MRPSELEILSCLKSVSSAIYNGSWLVILKLKANI